MGPTEVPVLPPTTSRDPTELPKQECGPTVCAEGEVCCNESCGICTPPGGVCIDQFCEPETEEPVLTQECGPTVCDEGEVCCNESCGICTPPGGFCITQFCEPETEVPVLTPSDPTELPK